MTIRAAEDSDIPSIVALLKLSLGESLMPKSEVFWRWKHIENPFGKSPVLLAFDEDKLIGVRAFMRWEWSASGKIIKAVRAVDTATHPDFHGMGIFSKLTAHLVDQCRDSGVDVIFNTPNKKSLPGYLKMGWYRVGRLPVQLNLTGRLSRPKQIRPVPDEYDFTEERINALNFGTPKLVGLNTHHSRD